jgi:hypothetical protein
MGAEIEPASHPGKISNLYETVIDLSSLCVTLSEISHYATDFTEQNLEENLLMHQPGTRTQLTLVGVFICVLHTVLHICITSTHVSETPAGQAITCLPQNTGIGEVRKKN